MTSRHIAMLLFLVFCFSLGCGMERSEKPQAKSKTTTKQQWHLPKVVVSKETTYFTGPLRPDGGIDYVAAINQRYSKGVTPKNNAAVALWQAAGPNELDKKIRNRYFKLLGIPELPEKGEYFTFSEDGPEYLAAKKLPDEGAEFSRKAWEEFNTIIKRPWSAKEYPLWAAVLKRNEKPLDILVAGLQRPRFYLPLVVGNNDIPMIAGSYITASNAEGRSAARLLSLRAMSRLHDGDISGAWQDNMALYRLARFGSRGPFMIGWLVGVTFDEMAADMAVTLSQHGGLSAKQAKKLQKQLENLPPLGSLKDICTEAERCSSLETLTLLANSAGVDPYFNIDRMSEQMRIARDPKLASTEPERKKRELAFRKLAADGNVDWSEVFRQYNIFWDEVVAGCGCSALSQAIGKLSALENRSYREACDLAERVLSEKPSAIKEMDSKSKAGAVAKLAIPFGPLHHWIDLIYLERRCQAYERMTLLAFALAGYRADHHGEYPKTLAELTPDYIDAIPKDPFTEGDLYYRQEKNGYLLYSVGQNGKDDSGFGRNNMPDSATEEQKKAWDDVSIRTPPKKSE